MLCIVGLSLSKLKGLCNAVLCSCLYVHMPCYMYILNWTSVHLDVLMDRGVVKCRVGEAIQCIVSRSSNDNTSSQCGCMCGSSEHGA